MLVDVARRLWRMFQIKTDKIGKWVKDKRKCQEFDEAHLQKLKTQKSI